MSATAIIQARLGGKPMVQQIIESLLAQKEISTIVLATSEESDNKELSDLAKKTNIEFFEGSRENVLSRFYHAMKKFGGDYIIRVTGDNPFTSGPFATLALNKAQHDRADLASISGIPLGTAVEIIKAEALSQCFLKAETSYPKEHVPPKRSI
jgi:spore coat polysaccharide biosynthesis protein SpsF